MSTLVERVLNKIAEGVIEIDDREIYSLLYPVGLPRYLGLEERYPNRLS